MSDDESFLVRWSRRKHQAAQEPEPADTETTPETEADAAAEQISGAPEKVVAAAPAPAAEATPAVFDPASLPTIESITAETDITAFLAPGVPVEIKRAALRRAWVSDPVIRDFIGLAENQWDFNAPDGVPGFGALQMTDAMRRLIADTVDAMGAPPAGAATAASPSGPVGAASRPQAAANAQQMEAQAHPQPVSEDPGPEATGGEATEGPDAGPSSDVLVKQDRGSDIAPQQIRAEVPSGPRRHGSALPG